MDIRWRISTDVGKYRVSTVLLEKSCLSEYFKHLPFETMVFPAKNGVVTSWLELYCDRYATEDEAVKGHEYVVESLQSGMKPREL